MLKIRNIVHLHFEAGLSQRQIATSQHNGYRTVSNYLSRARKAGLSWPLPEGIGERELGAALFPPLKAGSETDFATPDFPNLQRELLTKGMTLLLLWQEYRELHPDDGYSYSLFCQRYNDWLGTQKRSMRQLYIAGDSSETVNKLIPGKK